MSNKSTQRRREQRKRAKARKVLNGAILITVGKNSIYMINYRGPVEKRHAESEMTKFDKSFKKIVLDTARDLSLDDDGDSLPE